ncbi:MAG TPA: hypothetical protein VLA43_13455, partial [Longimicrobiales bacterium]|nr:hypothetical protein [Longimicrobiales bacterium]
ARSILEGSDYALTAEREFADLRRAGIVNRFLWEMGRFGGYAPVMAALRWTGPERALRWMHRPSPVQSLLWPVARRWAERSYGRKIEARATTPSPA